MLNEHQINRQQVLAFFQGTADAMKTTWRGLSATEKLEFLQQFTSVEFRQELIHTDPCLEKYYSCFGTILDYILDDKKYGQDVSTQIVLVINLLSDMFKHGNIPPALANKLKEQDLFEMIFQHLDLTDSWHKVASMHKFFFDEAADSHAIHLGLIRILRKINATTSWSDKHLLIIFFIDMCSTFTTDKEFYSIIKKAFEDFLSDETKELEVKKTEGERILQVLLQSMHVHDYQGWKLYDTLSVALAVATSANEIKPALLKLGHIVKSNLTIPADSWQRLSAEEKLEIINLFNSSGLRQHKFKRAYLYTGYDLSVVRSNYVEYTDVLCSILEHVLSDAYKQGINRDIQQQAAALIDIFAKIESETECEKGWLYSRYKDFSYDTIRSIPNALELFKLLGTTQSWTKSPTFIKFIIRLRHTENINDLDLSSTIQTAFDSILMDTSIGKGEALSRALIITSYLGTFIIPGFETALYYSLMQRLDIACTNDPELQAYAVRLNVNTSVHRECLGMMYAFAHRMSNNTSNKTTNSYVRIDEIPMADPVESHGILHRDTTPIEGAQEKYRLVGD